MAYDAGVTVRDISPSDCIAIVEVTRRPLGAVASIVSTCIAPAHVMVLAGNSISTFTGTLSMLSHASSQVSTLSDARTPSPEIDMESETASRPIQSTLSGSSQSGTWTSSSPLVNVTDFEVKPQGAV